MYLFFSAVFGDNSDRTYADCAADTLITIEPVVVIEMSTFFMYENKNLNNLNKILK